MQSINYDRLMELGPTHLGSVLNQNKEKVDFYEHPLKGEDSPVLAVIHKHKVAAYTDFFGTEDFFPDSDYNPIFNVRGLVCAFELDL
jgi:hypothetical protein